METNEKTTAKYRMTGYISLCRLTRGETRWFFTAAREFGLWYVTAHGFGLFFSIIGPFRLIKGDR